MADGSRRGTGRGEEGRAAGRRGGVREEGRAAEGGMKGRSAG